MKKIKDLKKDEEKINDFNSKIRAYSLIIGLIVAFLAFWFLKYAEYSPLIIVIALILLGILAIFVSLKLCGKVKPKPMDSETWIYMGIGVFMAGGIMDSLEVFKILGFVYFMAGLFRRKIENKKMSEDEGKKFMFYVIFSLFLLFIFGIIFFFLFNKN